MTTKEEKTGREKLRRIQTVKCCEAVHENSGLQKSIEFPDNIEDSLCFQDQVSELYKSNAVNYTCSNSLSFETTTSFVCLLK